MGGTGLGLATARGQVETRGQVLVLCSGGGLVQVVLDADGQPTGQSRFCPDLAATALAALDLPPSVLPVAADMSAPVAGHPAAHHHTGQPPRGFSARAPPTPSA